jgi:CheY-like chemotaxis protein
VLVARHPAEAVPLVASHDETVHLLVTDVVMPLISSPELAERIKALHADIPVGCPVDGHPHFGSE